MEVGERLIGQAIELTALGVALDLLVKPRRFERLEPGAEFFEFIGREVRCGTIACGCSRDEGAASSNASAHHCLYLMVRSAVKLRVSNHAPFATRAPPAPQDEGFHNQISSPWARRAGQRAFAHPTLLAKAEKS